MPKYKVQIDELETEKRTKLAFFFVQKVRLAEPVAQHFLSKITFFLTFLASWHHFEQA